MPTWGQTRPTLKFIGGAVHNTIWRRLARISVFITTLGLASSGLAIERWFYVSQNLWVDQNITNLVALMQRASQAGYTHMLINDSKFSRLATMDAHYFRNLNILKQAATNTNLEIVPALFPVGYSNDLLFNDPNLIEGLPARSAVLTVSNGIATIAAEPAISFPGGDFADLARWSWKDSNVVAENGTAHVTNPNGANARIVQQLTVHPFRQYHISVSVKTTNFLTSPQVLVLAGDQTLNYDYLGVRQTQDCTTHHVTFNLLSNSVIAVYL